MLLDVYLNVRMRIRVCESGRRRFVVCCEYTRVTVRVRGGSFLRICTCESESEGKVVLPD